MILGLPDPPARTLSDWLQTATQGLTDASKERIRPEIEAHYAQAVEAHRDNGLSESEAQKAALAELGDANNAGKRFRKQHLTEWDTDRIKTWYKQARSFHMLLFAYFLFCYVTPGLFRYNWLASHLLIASAFLVWLALPTMCFVVARYTRAKPDGLVFFILILLSELGTCTFFYAAWIVQPAFKTVSLTVNCFITILYLSFAISRFVSFLRLWTKLSKARATNPGRAS